MALLFKVCEVLFWCEDKPLDYLKRIDDNLVVLRCYCLCDFVDNDVRGYCMELEALDLCCGGNGRAH